MPVGTSYHQNRAKQKFMRRNLFSRLDYAYMEDIEGAEEKVDGRQVPNNPNSFINIAEMRANRFQLQHHFDDVLLSAEKPKDDPKGQLHERS